MTPPTEQSLHDNRDRKATNDRGAQDQLPGTELEGRFAMIPGCAVHRLAPENARAFRTLIALATHARREGRTAYVRQSTLAELVGIGRRTVQRDLELLIEAGLVDTVRPDRDRPLMYSLIDPCGACIDPAEGTTQGDAPPREGYDTVSRRGTTPDDVPVAPPGDATGTEPLTDPEQTLSETKSSIESEVTDSINAEVDAAIDRGEVRNPDAYRRKVLSDADTRSRHRGLIEKRRRDATAVLAVTRCRDCDDRGLRWTTAEGEPVPATHIDADTASKCSHGQPAPRPEVSEPSSKTQAAPGVIEALTDSYSMPEEERTPAMAGPGRPIETVGAL